jgi:hypothetical protein
MVGQCQQEQSGALEEHDDRLAKSLLRRRALIAGALFHFFVLKITIGGMQTPAALTAQTPRPPLATTPTFFFNSLSWGWSPAGSTRHGGH